nr:MAG TPA: hypothetical protein [Caudoviricetes sp.]
MAWLLHRRTALRRSFAVGRRAFRPPPLKLLNSPHLGDSSPAVPLPKLLGGIPVGVLMVCFRLFCNGFFV